MDYRPKDMESTDHLLDCGSTSCWFALEKSGQRVNGGCKCLSRPLDPQKSEERRMRAQNTARALKARIREDAERLLVAEMALVMASADASTSRVCIDGFRYGPGCQHDNNCAKHHAEDYTAKAAAEIAKERATAERK